METQHLLIVGGGLAGLSAGCYALKAGFRTTIVEHNLALGGVCRSWQRGPYTIDGCIHFLMGGPYEKIYEELEIVPAVKLQPLREWVTYRDVRDEFELQVTEDLGSLFAEMRGLSESDSDELARMREGCSAMVDLAAPLDAQELTGFREALHATWEMRGAAGALLHFRKPVGVWANEHLKSARLRRVFSSLVPETAPAFFLLMVLGYLERGYLSRPIGGTAAFRDALLATYRRLGGQEITHATVDEVLIKEDRAQGVRLSDGRQLAGDCVLSTASYPETMLRLLAGRIAGSTVQTQLKSKPLFDPIVLASFGVDKTYTESPSLLTLDGLNDLSIGGHCGEQLYVRVCNDDPCFAPAGHCVIQAMAPTDYDWWATRGTQYTVEKQNVATQLIEKLDSHFFGFRAHLKEVDIATPLTYWNMALSWRGSYEGWMPSAKGFFSPMSKRVADLDGFYMAGQWVEPGGGVPTAVLSGRQAVQLMCKDECVPFSSRRPSIESPKHGGVWFPFSAASRTRRVLQWRPSRQKSEEPPVANEGTAAS